MYQASNHHILQNFEALVADIHLLSGKDDHYELLIRNHLEFLPKILHLQSRRVLEPFDLLYQFLCIRKQHIARQIPDYELPKFT